MTNNFNSYAPTEVVFGKDTHKETGAYVKKYGGRSEERRVGKECP